MGATTQAGRFDATNTTETIGDDRGATVDASHATSASRNQEDNETRQTPAEVPSDTHTATPVAMRLDSIVPDTTDYTGSAATPKALHAEELRTTNDGSKNPHGGEHPSAEASGDPRDEEQVALNNGSDDDGRAGASDQNIDEETIASTDRMQDSAEAVDTYPDPPQVLEEQAGASAADSARLADDLRYREAASLFTDSGELKEEVIAASTEIIHGEDLKNTGLIRDLTSDGSNIEDWGKCSTTTFGGTSGEFQVHFYDNSVLDRTYYEQDCKAKFNRGVDPWSSK
jgi:hypothetical protein